MKTIVTPVDQHPVITTTGEPFEGTTVVVNSHGVWLDGVRVIQRDRRIKRNRIPGHPWLTSDPGREPVVWTSFTVRVDA